LKGLYDLAVALVVAGVSVGMVMLWLRRLGRQHMRRMDSLLALRQQLHDDLLGTLALHQHALAQLGLHNLGWHGSWYGTPVAGGLGNYRPAPFGALKHLAGHEQDLISLGAQHLSQSFHYDDISLDFRVGLKGLRGERRLFAIQAAEVLFAMIQGALAARQLALFAAVNQRARVGVFLQHDMRNLAQWVQLVAEDFADAHDDATLMTRARRLRSHAPLAAARAQRMSQALLNPTWQPSVAVPPALEAQHDLAAHLLDAAEMHGVEISLEGGAAVEWDAQALATVLDNVLGNVSGISRERLLPAHCRVVIDTNLASEMVQLRFETPHLPLEIPLEKLFEPWSGSGSVSKGLGLYQSRKQAQQAGGQLFAERLGAGIAVTLCVPCKKS
jgi:signal transduction histidine kinase